MVKNLIKRYLYFIIGVVLTIVNISYVEDVKGYTTNAIDVIVSIERFTIGQGYLVEPTVIQVDSNCTANEVLDKIAELKGMTVNYSTEDFEFGVGHLTSIDNADTGKINIPEMIQKMPDIYEYIEFSDNLYRRYCPPNNDSVNSLYDQNCKLGEKSYHELSRWCWTLNGEIHFEDYKERIIKDGDIVRFQFSVYGEGDDLELYKKNSVLADKNELTKQVALTSSNQEYSVARKNAIVVLEKFDATQREVDSALNMLKPQIEQSTPKKITVSKVKNVKIKKLKGRKAKISWKKLPRVKGYKIRYSTKKNFKKANVITLKTNKNNRTIKKLKIKKVYYVQVRAYKNFDGKTYLGKWSTKKKFKIKK